MQDSWRERIELDKDLLSLGNHQKIFSGDGGGGDHQLPWNVSGSRIATSDGSSSSAVVSPSDGRAEEKASSENSDQSGCVLKEHDYIGMAEISSAASAQSKVDTDDLQELNLKETDLCLGLGLGLAPSSRVEALQEGTGKTIAFTFSQQETAAKTAVDPAMVVGQMSLQASWPNAPVKTITVDKPLPKANGDFQPPQICLSMQEFGSNKAGTPHVATVFPGSCVVSPPVSKNGVKRGYTEAMSDAARFNMASEAVMVVKNVDADVKAAPKHPQSSFLPSWAPAKSMVPASWHVALEQPAPHSFGASKPAPVAIAPRVDKPVVDCAATAYKGSRNQPEIVHDSTINEAPPPKGQVVGWPPIRSYRKNTLAKPAETFVKVNMDGVTVGRKVDLNSHNSYEGLLVALEEMFQPSNTGQGGSQAAHGNDIKQFRLLNGSDYVLTYEDKDGDWMLVGDVPWSMFTNTVRRLRITRGPEATGLGARGSEKLKC